MRACNDFERDGISKEENQDKSTRTRQQNNEEEKSPKANKTAKQHEGSQARERLRPEEVQIRWGRFSFQAVEMMWIQFRQPPYLQKYGPKICHKMRGLMA